jgi:membrane-associated phospholipid phosphatase
MVWQFLSFFFNITNLSTWIQGEWSQIYDAAYVERNWIGPLLRCSTVKTFMLYLNTLNHHLFCIVLLLSLLCAVAVLLFAISFSNSYSFHPLGGALRLIFWWLSLNPECLEGVSLKNPPRRTLSPTNFHLPNPKLAPSLHLSPYPCRRNTSWLVSSLSFTRGSHMKKYYCLLYNFKSNQIKCIYIALHTSADISKCCTETQPKTPNSKQCMCRSTVARKNS